MMPLVTAIRSVTYAITKPLMNLVSMDPELATPAKEFGAKEEWYTLPEMPSAAADADE